MSTPTVSYNSPPMMAVTCVKATVESGKLRRLELREKNYPPLGVISHQNRQVCITVIGGGARAPLGGRTQHWGGGARATPKVYKLTPMDRHQISTKRPTFMQVCVSVKFRAFIPYCKDTELALLSGKACATFGKKMTRDQFHQE